MDKTKLPKSVTVVDHPLVLHKLTLMRDKHTPSAVFRQLLREISLLLAYEVARDLPITTQTIETPLAEMEAPILKGKKLGPGNEIYAHAANEACPVEHLSGAVAFYAALVAKLNGKV